MEPAKTFPIYQLMDAFEAFTHGEAEAKPQHRSLYYYLLGRARKLGNVTKYTLPYENGMHGSGIGSWATYDAALKMLHKWGFIEYTPGANRYKTPVVAIQFRNPTDDVLLTYWQSYCLSTSSPIDSPTDDSNRLIELGKERIKELGTTLLNLEGQKKTDNAAIAALRLENSQLLERLEKAKEEFRALRQDNEALKASATTRLKKVSRSHAFADSPYADVQAVAAALKGTDYEHADTGYYHETIRNWAEGKGEKKIDWLATIRNAMLRDSKEGKLKFNPNSTQTQYVDPQRNAATIREREQRLGLVDSRALSDAIALSRSFSAVSAAAAVPAHGPAQAGLRGQGQQF